MSQQIAVYQVVPFLAGVIVGFLDDAKAGSIFKLSHDNSDRADGSIPRPLKLLDAIERCGSSHPRLEPLDDEAVRNTIEQLEATGSPVITDGEQRKYQNFATYCVEGLPNTAPDGFKLPFADGHARRWPRLTAVHFAIRCTVTNFLIGR